MQSQLEILKKRLEERPLRSVVSRKPRQGMARVHVGDHGTKHPPSPTTTNPESLPERSGRPLTRLLRVADSEECQVWRKEKEELRKQLDEITSSSQAGRSLATWGGGFWLDVLGGVQEGFSWVVSKLVWVVFFVCLGVWDVMAQLQIATIILYMHSHL